MLRQVSMAQCQRTTVLTRKRQQHKDTGRARVPAEEKTERACSLKHINVMQGADGWIQGNLTGFFNETYLISA